jgi:hypothetical protein
MKSWLLVGGIAVLLDASSVSAGSIHAEAGGPKQRERAEREWAREPRETRDRVDREMRQQEHDRQAAERAEAERNRIDAERRAAEAKAAQAARDLEGMTITKADARRQNIVDKTGAVLKENGRTLDITSGARKNSEAHKRGAIDFSSKGLDTEARHAEAAEVSEELGSDHTVIVEEVHEPAGGAEGPRGQVDTAYRNGDRGNVRVHEVRASATHTHVQPERSEPVRVKSKEMERLEQFEELLNR